MYIVHVDNLKGISGEEHITGTLFVLPSGQIWRAYSKGIKRMTRADGTLKTGEARWMPTESCKVAASGRLLPDMNVLKGN